MAQTLFEFPVQTKEKQSFTTLDGLIEEAVRKSGIRDGIVVVFCPHTTAAITINENADPDVKIDMKFGLDETFPNRKEYRHMEGNTDGHMKSSMVGASETLLLSNGQLVLGTWQSVYFLEFDGPRNRTVYVKVMEG